MPGEKSDDILILSTISCRFEKEKCTRHGDDK